MNFNADDNIAEGGGREGREVTAGDPCQRARNRNATRRVDGALPRERDVGISGRNYTGGDLKARATRIAARAPNKYIYIYIYSEKKRERDSSSVMDRRPNLANKYSEYLFSCERTRPDET